MNTRDSEMVRSRGGGSKTPRELGTLAKLAYAPVGLAYRGGKDVVKGANNVRPLRAVKGLAELGLLAAALG